MTANITGDVAMKKLTTLLEPLDLAKLCRETGFVKRKPLKAEGDEFLLGFLNAVFCNEVSLMSLAFSIGQFIGDTLSKVAVWKRLNAGFAALLNRILALLLSEHLPSDTPRFGGELLKPFNHVFIQDSTTISLAAKFAEFFPGSGTNNGKKAATLKIQLIYEALAERFSFFDIGSFRDNDQKASPLILKVAQAGDLVLRDLGYFVLEVFAQLQERGASFLSRLQYGVNIYTQEGSCQINLVKLLKKHRRSFRGASIPLDFDVRVGRETQLPVRLVVIPLPNDVANEKRRKAKNNRDRRANPGQDYLYLLGFNLFITNVERQIWTPKQVAQVYSLRWRIEIIFKTWKSHFAITDVPTSTATCVEAYIYAMLIYITLIHTRLFIAWYQMLYTQQNKHLSLVKVAKLLRLILFSKFQHDSTKYGRENLIRQILYHGAYEVRKKRLAYPQMINR